MQEKTSLSHHTSTHKSSPHVNNQNFNLLENSYSYSKSNHSNYDEKSPRLDQSRNEVSKYEDSSEISQSNYHSDELVHSGSIASPKFRRKVCELEHEQTSLQNTSTNSLINERLHQTSSKQTVYSPRGRNETPPTDTKSKIIDKNQKVTPTNSVAHRESVSESFRQKYRAKPQIIPKFYFPFGSKDNTRQNNKNQSNTRNTNSNKSLNSLSLKDSCVIDELSTPESFEESIQIQLNKVKTAFQNLPGGRIAKLMDMDKITSACDCPIYWRRALFNAVGGHRAGSITGDHFLRFWENVIRNYHDRASRFIAVVSTQRKNYTDNTKNRNDSSNISNVNYKPPKQETHYLEFNDFMSVVQDIVDNHAGLSFLSQAPEFHSRYIQTVICRIFYHIKEALVIEVSISWCICFVKT